MINIKMMQEYLATLHSEHPGVVNNIFLANNESTPPITQTTFWFPLNSDTRSLVFYLPSSTTVSTSFDSTWQARRTEICCS